MSKPLGKKRDRYRKMPLKTKILFLKRVLEEGQSIKKVSAQYKMNYSTAKTLIRNEKLKKGKTQLSQLNFQNCSFDKQPTQSFEQIGTVATYRAIESKLGDQKDIGVQPSYPKIQIYSRISFPS